jgi:hypothetical protein
MRPPREIDMSPRAIAARLDSVRALYRLALYLGAFKAVEAAAAPGAEASSSCEPEADGEPVRSS